MEIAASRNHEEPSVLLLENILDTFTRINSMISNNKMKQNKTAFFWLSIWSSRVVISLTRCSGSPHPKPHLQIPEAPSNQGIAFTVLLMNLSQGLDLNKSKAAMVRSEMVGLFPMLPSVEKELPPTPSLLLEYLTLSTVTLSNIILQPLRFQSLNLYSHNLWVDPFTSSHPPPWVSPLCGWSLPSGGRSWETGPTLQRTQVPSDRWNPTPPRNTEGPTPTELTGKGIFEGKLSTFFWGGVN